MIYVYPIYFILYTSP